MRWTYKQFLWNIGESSGTSVNPFQNCKLILRAGAVLKVWFIMHGVVGAGNRLVTCNYNSKQGHNTTKLGSCSTQVTFVLCSII